MGVEVKVEMIRALIPLGLMHANGLLQEEVSRLAGEPCQRADGRKVPLGFVQTGTENEKVISSFLRALLDRGRKSQYEFMFDIAGRV